MTPFRAGPHMQLERLQADFAAALIDIHRFAALAPVFRESGARALDRFALYRGNVAAAWEKALTHAFPVVGALVGNEFFSGLARAYGHTHPSTSGDLNVFGAQFAEFIARFEPTQTLPYLGDVAALEWAVHRAHYAADADALARECVACLAPAELLAARFALHPAVAWFESRHRVASIWLAHQPGSSDRLPSRGYGECALIVRPHWRVEVVMSGAAEIAALAQLRAGADMAHAIGAALAIEAGFDVAKALVRWIDLAVLTDVASR
ncbi:MAG: DUF2063 domain-containing protein [Gammaproteobacteria bacterium]|nr:MAG: DUF2063 domain-containing protein [Gammaproteobacteria bacterium]